MYYISKKNIIFFFIFFIFLIIYSLPIISNIFLNFFIDDELLFFTGTNNVGGTRLIQFLPILSEIILEKNIFENSVDRLLPGVNFENIRLAPFLIATIPSVFFNKISSVIAVNYFITFFLNVLIVHLILNIYLKKPILSLFLAINCFITSGFININIFTTLKNIFIFKTNNFLNYSHISNNLEIIFQSLSNFILLLFLYCFLKYLELPKLKNQIILLTIFIFLGFSYQIHFVIGYGIIFVNYLLNLDFKNFKLNSFNLNFILSTIIFIIVSYLQYILINQASWSTADYSEINNITVFIDKIFDIFLGFDILSFRSYFFNAFFLIPLSIFFFLKNYKFILKNIIPVLIISVFFSALYFSTDFLYEFNKRVLIRGLDVILGVLVFLSLGLFFIKLEKKKFLKLFFIILLVYISAVPTIKFINMANYSINSKSAFIPNEKYKIYEFIKKNVPANSIIASTDPYDWELIPVLTSSDMYFSSIFNSYRNPEDELKRYFDLKKFLGITFEEFSNDFNNIFKIRNKFKKNVNLIMTSKKENSKILEDKREYENYMFSRNIIGLTIAGGLIFKEFNGKKIEYSETSFKTILIPEMKKIYEKSNENEIFKLDYLIINSEFKSSLKSYDFLKEMFKNDQKIVYKILKK